MQGGQSVIDPALAGSDRSLSVAYLASVLPPLAAHYGFDAAELLERAALSPDLMQRSDELIPLVDVFRLFLLVLERTGDPGLGFEAGRRVRPRSYQVLGYVLASSADVGQAIERLQHFEKLAGNLGSTHCARRGGRVRLSWTCPVAGMPARFLTEAAVTGWVAFAGQLVEDPPAPRQVCFRHPAPREVQRYHEYFRCPVHFDADFDGLEFDEDVLALPLVSADPGLGALMEREALSRLADYDSQTNLIAAVRSEVYHLLADGEPGIEKVARKLGMAERTLQARLQRQGVNFQQVVDGLRRSLADIYLRDPRLSLTDISMLLGFSEQSSFTRAFRRWRGESPAQFRQRLR